MIRPHADFRRDHPKPGWTYRVLSPEETAKLQRQDHIQRNAHRLSPEEYTRILLKAKEGDISPGEANRRIVKFGGGVRIRPLPRRPD